MVLLHGGGPGATGRWVQWERAELFDHSATAFPNEPERP